MPESIAHTQEVHPVLNVTAYNMAMNVCESLGESRYHCHWIPKSTGTLCQACPAICRAIDHTLNFIQFTIGAFIFQSTMSVARVSIMIMISDVVSKDYLVRCFELFLFHCAFIPLGSLLQSVVMGLAYASTGVSRSVTPLFSKLV